MDFKVRGRLNHYVQRVRVEGIGMVIRPKISSENFLQFDFKVDNIDEARQDFCNKGLNPSQIVRRNPGHDSFTLIGPDHCEVKINSGFNRK